MIEEVYFHHGKDTAFAQEEIPTAPPSPLRDITASFYLSLSLGFRPYPPSYGGLRVVLSPYRFLVEFSIGTTTHYSLSCDH